LEILLALLEFLPLYQVPHASSAKKAVQAPSQTDRCGRRPGERKKKKKRRHYSTKTAQIVRKKKIEEALMCRAKPV